MIFKYIPTKSYLNEMSLNRQSIELRVLNKSDIIREHLMKIYLYNNITTDHWISEIYSALHEIPRCKSNNKFLSSADIKDNLFYSWSDCYEERLDNYINDIEIAENNVIDRNFSNDDLLNFIEDYCEWLSNRLSEYGFVSRGEVKDEIYSLLHSRRI